MHILEKEQNMEKISYPNNTVKYRYVYLSRLLAQQYPESCPFPKLKLEPYFISTK